MTYRTKRNNDTGYTIALGLVLVALVMMFINSFFVMIFLGYLHDHGAPALPALGYWASFILVGLVSVLGSVWNSTVTQKLALLREH